ncbi:amidinotransferase [Nakamurella silvestris]|nr:amidinotransferase [Nakamurella silvestris]
MTSTLAVTADSTHSPTTRRYLMCRPTHFEVAYSINPWMDVAVPVDRELAERQWESLVATYRALGHTVDIIEGVPGLPDMVFAANSAAVVGGKVFAANMHSPERRGEQAPYRQWFAEHFTEVHLPLAGSEGQGDFTWTGSRLLAGTGYRTDPEAHAEAAARLEVPVVGLELTDPRFYHLDTALFVLGHEQIAYYPQAFSDRSRAVLERLYPDAVLATTADALCLGLNAVSDGATVVIAPEATDLIAQLHARGYRTIGLDLSELLKAGGGAKCCTLEIHP